MTNKLIVLLLRVFITVNYVNLFVNITGLYGEYTKPYYDSTRTMVGIVINYVLGAIVIVLALLSAVRENLLMFKIYAGSILVSFFFEVLNNFVIPDVEADKAIAKSYVVEKWKDEEKRPCSMGYIQHKYSCCGKDSSSDYEIVLGRKIPQSCYSKDTGALYNHGCFTAIENFVSGPTGLQMFISFALMIVMFSVAWVLIVYLTKQRNQADD